MFVAPPLLSFRWTARIVLGVRIALLWAAPAFGADVIYFKDGMRTLCHGNAWEEKDEVHCEYGGGLLIYSKKDVTRIEKGPTIAEGRESNTSQNPGPIPPQPAAAASLPPSPAALGPSPQAPSGILFYDPRRAKKYWSSPTVHHESYTDALSSFAAEFNRPVSWIEENMGESNDLREIREALTAPSKTSAHSSSELRDHVSNGGIEFYNPRRAKKYWTSTDAHYDTLDQAVDALAAEFGKPPAWIELHMGEVNDVEQLRQTLKQAQAEGEEK